MLALLLIAGALHVEARPGKLELGKRSTRAELRIASDAEPALSASAGRVVDLRPDGPGAWTAWYLPPKETYPQIAIVAAVAGGELAWTAIPLSGSGLALVKTRPGARISVVIGDRSFGPAQADELGKALVPVVVPPGVHEVRHLGQRIELPVPPMKRLHLVLLQGSAPADRAERIPVRVLVAGDDGLPRAGAQVVFQPGRGEVSAAEERAPGELWATWALPPGASGKERLAAALAEAPGLLAEAVLKLDPGAAAAVELTAEKDRAVAGEGELVLHARSRDAAGNASPEPLAVVDPSGFGALAEVSPGEWRLRLPDSFDGRGTLELVAHPRDRAGPAASVVLHLVPAAPASATIVPEATSVRTGPGTRLRLRVLRSDRFGNTVQGPAPEASASEGSFGALDAQPDGAYLATYRPPQAWGRDETVLEMRWPGTAARSHLELLPPLAPLALSPKLGALSNFARLTSPLVALEVSLRSERWGPELAFSAEAAWYFVSRRQESAAGPAQARSDFFALSAQVSLRKRLGARTTLWAAAGPSFAALSSRLQLGGQPRISESALVPGAILSLGVERRYARALPFSELRWSWHADPALSTLTGAVSAVSLLLGTRFELL